MKLDQLFQPVNWSDVKIKYSGKEDELVLRTRRAYEGSGKLSEVTTKRDLQLLASEISDPSNLKGLFRDRTDAEIQAFVSNIEGLREQLGAKKGALFSDFSSRCDEMVKETLATRNAEDEFGNKAANLLRMQQHLKSALIPPLTPIPHRSIQQFLKLHGVDLQKVINSVRAQDTKTGEVLCPESRAILKEAQQRVIELFAQHQYDGPELKQFLDSLPSSDYVRVMVRSTSHEDSDVNTNAGGNKTIPGVLPDEGKISRAIGEVVASTLSEKSLVQSLRAGESVYHDPFVPVLLQIMVGENPAIAISGSTASVTSGVMFTTEPEGQFTPMVQLQSSWGHGEGVVTSRVFCDTHYLYPGEAKTVTTHAILREKPERLVPTGEGGDMQVVDNDPQDWNASSLPPAVLTRLHDVAVEIRELYSKPMDIEWVYDKTNDQIYVVQARPLGKKEGLAPTFLKLDDLTDRRNGRLIVAAGSSVRQASKPSELLIADTLSEVLDAYVAMNETQRDEIKGVICKKWAASTSHEATTFRGESLPVIKVDDLEIVKQALDAGKTVLLDPQQELVAWVDDSTDLDALTCKGWKNYPIAKEQSLLPLPLSSDELLADLKDLVIDDGPLNLEGFSEQIKSLSDIDNPERALANLSNIVKVLIQMLKRYPPSEFFATKDVFMNLVMAAKELRWQLRKRPIDQMGVLAAKRWLETTIFQERGEAVAGHSLLEYFTDLKARKQVEEVWPKEGHPPVGPGQVSVEEAKSLLAEYLKLVPAQFNTDHGKQFGAFVLALAVSRDEKTLGRFNQMIKLLQQQGTLTLFLNETFAPTWKSSNKDVQGCLLSMAKALNKNLKSLSTLDPLNTTLSKWERRISQWADPGAFDALYEQLTKTLVPWMQDDRLLKTISDPQSSRVERSMGMHYMFRIVDCVDKTIKSVKGATDVDGQVRVAHVAKLLEPYHAMMEQCVNAIPAERFDSWVKRIPDEEGQSKRPQMLSTIASAFERCRKEPTASQLMPSGTCSVASCCVGSGANFARQFVADKVTLEDLFSLMHQNILKSIAVLNQDGGLRLEELPMQLRPIAKTVSHFEVYIELYMVENFMAKPDLISVDASDYPYINLDFNMPLVNHSATFEVQFNCLTGTSTVSLNLFGHDSGGRMSKLLPLAFVESSLRWLSLVGSPTCRNGQWRAQWKFKEGQTQEQMKAFSTLINQLVMGTFGRSNLYFTRNHEECVKLLNQDTAWYRTLKFLTAQGDQGSWTGHRFQDIATHLARGAKQKPELLEPLASLVERVPEMVHMQDKRDLEVVEGNFDRFMTALKAHPDHLWQLVFNMEDTDAFVKKLLDANIPCDFICPEGKSPIRIALQGSMNDQLLNAILERSPNQAENGELILDLIHSGKQPELIPMLEAKGAALTPELLAADLSSQELYWSFPSFKRLQPYLEQNRDQFAAIHPLLLERLIATSSSPEDDALDWITYLIEQKQVDLSVRDKEGRLKYISLLVKKASTNEGGRWGNPTMYLHMLETLLKATTIAPDEQLANTWPTAPNEIPKTVALLKRYGITIIENTD